MLYKAFRNEDHELIVVKHLGECLSPRFDLAVFNPHGFECGYPGTGARQLSLAILADLSYKEDQLFALSERLCMEVIAKLPRDGWLLAEWTVQRVLLTGASGFTPSSHKVSAILLSICWNIRSRLLCHAQGKKTGIG